MGWGSNASFNTVPCPYCEVNMIDDTDSWPTSHMEVCSEATIWKRILYWFRSIS